MNTCKAIIGLIVLIFIASVTLPSGIWYLYPLGGGCAFLAFITSIWLCCHSDEFKDCVRRMMIDLWKYIRRRCRKCFLARTIRSWQEQGKTRCPLCRVAVENEEWESGEHRGVCAMEHAEELGRMAHTHREWGPKKCPKCEVAMKVWPEDYEKFQCANNRLCRQSEGGSVVNRGEPPWMKFSCFTCNINFCSTCVLDEASTELEEAHLDIGTDDLDPMARLDDLPFVVDLPSPDIPRTQVPQSVPWVPSAPPDDTKSGSPNMNPPSYQEAIAP